jgi:hypothetical protein
MHALSIVLILVSCTEKAEQHDEDGLSFEYIKDRLFKHSKIPATQLRIRLKQVANFDRTNEGKVV